MNADCLIMDLNPSSDSLRTSKTLLEALGGSNNNQSCARFYALYHRFVAGIVRRGGLQPADAEEVIQDVFIHSLRNIHTFQSDPDRGTFRGWLARLARWRVEDRRRKIARERGLIVDLNAPFADETGTGSDPIQDLPDPTNAERESDETDWQQLILTEALARLAETVPAKHYQVFTLYSLQHQSVLRVARDLGVNPGAVYLIGHRLTKKLRVIVEELKGQID